MLRVTLFSAVLAAASATRLESLRLRGGQQACNIRLAQKQTNLCVRQLLP